MAVDCTPEALANAAKCFECLPRGAQLAVMNYLLCQIANNPGGGGTSVLPNGQIFVGNAANVATAVPMSKDATIDNTGALTLANTATARSDIGLGTTDAPRFARIGIGAAADATNTAKIVFDHNSVAGTVALDIETSNTGSATDLTAVKINSPAGGTASAASIQVASVETFGVAWNGVVSATGYNELEFALGTTGAVTINGTQGSQFTCALSGNVTFSFANMASGRTFKVIVTG